MTGLSLKRDQAAVTRPAHSAMRLGAGGVGWGVDAPAAAAPRGARCEVGGGLPRALSDRSTESLPRVCGFDAAQPRMLAEPVIPARLPRHVDADPAAVDASAQTLRSSAPGTTTPHVSPAPRTSDTVDAPLEDRR